MYTYVISQLVAQLAKPDSLPEADITSTIKTGLQITFAAMALLSVVFVALGGFKYTTSNGDPQGTAKAKGTILYALIGLIVGLSAFTIVTFVLGRVG